MAIARKNSRRPRRTSPLDMPWARMAVDINPKKVGQYTVNPEVPDDFSSKRIHVLSGGEIDFFVGRPLFEVAVFVAVRYGDTYIIPDVKYWQWVRQNPNLAPDILKDGNWSHFFGSLICGLVGDWRVPFVYRVGSRFGRNGRWLGSQWRSIDRVVLLEK